MDPAIVWGRLSNGLTYYVLECHRPAYKANFYLIELVGSTVEEPDQLGMSHFIEHLAFDGTRNFPGRGIIESLERHGLNFGYDINASTGMDATVFSISNVLVNEDNGELLDSCLLMLKDISCALSIEPQMVEKERAIIMEEWRQGNDAYSRMLDQMLPILYGQGNKYTQRPIGRPEQISSFTADGLREYYEKWYQPQHQAVVVIGYVEPESVAERIKEVWGDVPAQSNPSVRHWEEVPNHQGLQTGVIADKEFPGCQVDFWYKVDLPDRKDRDLVSYINDSYLGFLAKTIMTSRFEKVLFAEDSPWTMGNVEYAQYYNADSKDGFRLYALYDRNRRDEALQCLLGQAKRAVVYGVTDDELEFARDAMRLVIDRLPNLASEKNNYEQFGCISEHFLKGNVVLSTDDEVRTYANFCDTVTVEAVNGFLSRVLVPDNMVAMLVEKSVEGVAMPTAQALRDSIMRMWSDLEVERPINDDKYKKPLIDFEIRPGRIVDVQEDTMFVARHYLLSNGAKVTLCQRRVLKDQVSMRAVQRGGMSVLLDSGFVDATFAPTMANLGGFGDFSLYELGRKMHGKDIDIELSYTPYAEIIEGTSSVGDLEQMLQLLYLRMTSVRCDSIVLNNWLKQKRGNLNDLKDNPDKVFSDSIRSILYGPGHKYMRTVNSADLDTIDFRHALSLVAGRLANPAAYHYIIVGNINLSEVEPMIEKYIGGLPGNGFETSARFGSIDRLAAEGERFVKFEHETPSEITKAYMAWEIHRPYVLADEITLDLLAAIVEKMCIQQLREEAGGTYTPYVGSASGEVDGYHSLYLTFDTNSESVDELIDAVNAMLHEIAENGPEMGIFDSQKDYLARSENADTKQQDFPMKHFTHLALYGDDDYMRRYRTMRNVTPEMVQDMAAALVQAPVAVTLVMVGRPQSESVNE